MKLTLSRKKPGHARKKTGYGSRLRPARDWLMLLGAWLVLFALSIGYQVWLFSRVTNGEALEEPAAVTERRPLDLDAATRVFDAREAERERYTDTYRFVDPSR